MIKQLFRRLRRTYEIRRTLKGLLARGVECEWLADQQAFKIESSPGAYVIYKLGTTQQYLKRLISGQTSDSAPADIVYYEPEIIGNKIIYFPSSAVKAS